MENKDYAVYLVYPKGKAVRLTSTPLPKFIANSIKSSMGKPAFKGAKHQVRKVPKRRS